MPGFETGQEKILLLFDTMMCNKCCLTAFATYADNHFTTQQLHRIVCRKSKLAATSMCKAGRF
jgi:hypothetical protein